MPEQSLEHAVDMANAVRLVTEHHRRIGELAFAQTQVAESQRDMAELFTALEGQEVFMTGIAAKRRLHGVLVRVAGGGQVLRPNKFVVVRGVSLSAEGFVDVTPLSTAVEERGKNHHQVPYATVTLFDSEESMLAAQSEYDRHNSVSPER